MNQEKIQEELQQAMKSGDKFLLSVLRMLKSSLQKEAINKKRPLTEEETLAVIKKEVKTRKDSKKEYEAYHREDLVSSLDQEIEILSRYLPEELTEEELNKIINSVFLEVAPTSMKDMGTLMKKIGDIVGAKADMSIVSTKVRERLMKKD